MKLLMPLLLLTLLALPVAVLAGTSPDGGTTDLSRHPLYQSYDLKAAPGVINVGIQPLWVPPGVIAEVMKRDRILHRMLATKGITIRFHPFLKGSDINFFLKQGKIDAAMAGDMPTILTASETDIVITALTSQGFTSIVTKGILTVDGLKRKRIGYPPLSIAHHTLIAALASADLKENDVRLVPMEISAMVDALASGRIDAFASWEPVPTIALRKIKNATTIFRHLNSSYLYFSRSLADRHPEAAALLVAAVIRSLAWMKLKEENLRLAAGWTLAAGEQLQGRPVGLSAEDIADITRKDILDIADQATIPERDLTDRGAIRKKFDFLKKQEKIAVAATLDKVLQSFDRGMIGRVMANPKHYYLGSFDYDEGKAGR